jgi:GDPmannose 4,6-dehydratase
MADPKALNLKTALILGISGQDGYFLAKLLLKNGYKVIGTTRHIDTTSPALKSLDQKNLSIIYADIRDTEGILNLITLKKPDEVYNLTGVSSVAYSFEHNEETLEANAYAVIRLFESLAQMGLHKIKFYQASSSEMFGKTTITPQSETTPLNPVSPYGVSKALAHRAADRFRKNEGLFIASGILYNHESPLRPTTFVTRKITNGAAKIKLGLSSELVLGNLDARRDWGFAGDYVEAMWKMLQVENANDFVVATGETHSVLDFVSTAFKYAGLVGAESKYLKTDPHFLRPTEIHQLMGDPNKTSKVLDWHRSVDFESLVKQMVANDLELLCNENGLTKPDVPAFN